MREQLMIRMREIERRQSEIEKYVASGVQSGVGNHCSFIEWYKLKIEYESLYRLLEAEKPTILLDKQLKVCYNDTNEEDFMSKKKLPKFTVKINTKKTWFTKAIERVEAGKPAFEKKGK